MDNLSWGTKFPPLSSGRPFGPLLSSAACSMKIFSENHSGDVNNDSGRTEVSFRIPPESLFTSLRNRYSEFLGTPIHMARNTQYKRLGTVSLLAGLDLHTGMVTEIVSDTHKSSDFSFHS
jgi:hypothetical protein